VEEILGDLTKIACVIHQTGDSKFKDFEKLEEKKLNLRNPERYLVKKWISVEDFSSILQKADLVISRAGINTLSELAYLGVPTLVIPIPYIYKNEQVINAKYFEKAELVNILYQSNLSPETLLANTEKMLNNLADLKANAKKAKELIIPKAAQRLALETVILGKQHEK
jgi:UDP-N-acetylglucosamine--N-acetylmuramyl-(pentapeptide) pyrophosphoryl-undecaprenol N-acetylglucosamine transferase